MHAFFPEEALAGWIELDAFHGRYKSNLAHLRNRRGAIFSSSTVITELRRAENASGFLSHLLDRVGFIAARPCFRQMRIRQHRVPLRRLDLLRLLNRELNIVVEIGWLRFGGLKI